MSNLPPPPPGFVLDTPASRFPAGGGNVPPPPPGFVLDAAPQHRRLIGAVTPMTQEERDAIQPSTNIEMNGKPVYRSGGFENATAGVNEMIYTGLGIPGMLYDRARNVMNWGIAGANALTGQTDLTTNMIRTGTGGDITPLGPEWWNRVFQKVGVPDPNNVIATNLGEQLARTGGQGVGLAIAPDAMIGLLARYGIVGEKALRIVGPMFGNSKGFGGVAKNAVAGAGAGIGAEAAMQAAPDEWDATAGVAGGLGGGIGGAILGEAPGMVRAAGRIAGDFLAPMFQGGQQRMAGQQLREAATSPGGVIDAIETAPGEFVAGSKPTTFQQTGDMGLGALERGVATRDPAPFQQRRADQNAVRLAAVENMQPTGSPEAVVGAVRSHLASIDRQTQQALDAATSGAQQAAARLGQGSTPDVAGDALRVALEAARGTAKAQERALWRAVDPDGTLALPAAGTKAQVAQIIREMPRSAKPPSGEEAAIHQAVQRYGNGPVALSELTALQGRVKTEMRAERIANGESPAYRRLAQINAAVQNDLENAVAQRVAQEQRAVDAGQMRMEDTAEFRLQQKLEDWDASVAARAAGDDGGARGIPNAGGPAATVPGSRGAGGEGRGGLGAASRDTRLAQNAGGNLDQAALDRLSAARGATRTRAETFDNPTLSPLRRRSMATGPYDMPPSAVAGRLFFSGPKSFDAIRTYRGAVGDPQALQVLRDFAVDRLRRAALRDDGTLDPAKVAAWRRAHSDALRAFPEFDALLNDAAQLSAAMVDAAAARRAALNDAQAGALGRLLGVDDPQDVTRIIGSLLSRGDAAAQLRALRQRIGDNPEAQEGLRKAIVDFIIDRFVSNTEAATSGLGAIKGDQLQSFIGQGKAALRAAGFDETEISVLDDIAADLQRANRSVAAVRIPGGSNTAQDVLAAKASDNTPSMLTKILLAAIASGSGGAFLAGPIAGIAASVGTGLLGVLRQRGLRTIDDLVREALLDPALARLLMIKARPRLEPERDGRLSHRVARSAGMGFAVQPEKPRLTPHQMLAEALIGGHPKAQSESSPNMAIGAMLANGGLAPTGDPRIAAIARQLASGGR